MLPLYQVDAFTHRPFAGNPAAVCLLERPADAGWMQQVAAEMNLAETAFVVPAGTQWGLRWFTPTVEVDLCGHATLAAAHVLWQQGLAAAGKRIVFESKSGPLVADQDGSAIWLDFPALPPREVAPPSGLIPALGVVPIWVGQGGDDWLVVVDSVDAVQSLTPDLPTLSAQPGRGVIVTALADGAGGAEWDLVSRFFAPGAGIDEDPVTGSAHCVLAPYWGGRLKRTELTGQQLSPRGGTVQMQWTGDRVRLGGQAVTVLSGSLTV